MTGDGYNSWNSRRTSRRRFLTATAVPAASLSIAGCLGSGNGGDESGDSSDGDDSTTTSDSGSSGAFGEIAFEGRELKAEITNDAVATVNVLHGGEKVGGGDVAAGASRVTVFKAGQTLHGKELKLVAVDDSGEEVGSTTASFAAQPQIARVRSQATKEGIEITESNIKDEYVKFSTSLVTVENTGDAPLFIPMWASHGDEVTVNLTGGVPNPKTPSDRDDRVREPGETKVVAPGESVEIKPYEHGSYFYFEATDSGANENWPEAIKEMGEWPDGYADGDTLKVPVVIEDDQGEQFEATVDVTYSKGLHNVARNGYVPGRVDSK